MKYELVYCILLTSLCCYQYAANKCSLEIDYKQFIYVHPNIAIWLADAPQSVLEVMEDVAQKFVFQLHPNYRNIHQKIYVRITNLPVHDQIRNIRYCNQKHLTELCQTVIPPSSPYLNLMNDKTSSLNFSFQIQADPLEYHDPDRGSCNEALWCVPPVATSKI